MGRFRGEVNLNRLLASRGDVTKGNLLLIPTVARRGGGFARGGACGAGAASIRRSRCTCGGARRSRGAQTGGACGCACSCICGCSRGIGRSRSRTCSGVRRTRGARGSGLLAACLKGISEGISVI